MRYQLPAGVASVSVQGLSFVADEDGQITVPDGLPPDVYQDLESPHHHNLKGVTETVHARDAVVAGDPLAEKRLLRELLRMHGVVLDGRATLPYLRELVVDTLDDRTGEQPGVAGQLADTQIAELAGGGEPPAEPGSPGDDTPAVVGEAPAASTGSGPRARRGKPTATQEIAAGVITAEQIPVGTITAE